MQLLGVIVEERGSLYIVTEYMAKVGGPPLPACWSHVPNRKCFHRQTDGAALAKPSQVER